MFFDDLGCLRDYLGSGADAAGRSARRSSPTTAPASGCRRPAAVYTEVPTLATPMASGLVAHADAASRDADAAAAGGAPVAATAIFGPGGAAGHAMTDGAASRLGVLALGRPRAPAVRSRWTQIFAVVFAVLALAVAASGYVLSGGHGVQDFSRTAVSLMQLVLLLVPLTALLLGVLALTPERGCGGAALLAAGRAAARCCSAGCSASSRRSRRRRRWASARRAR